MQQTGVSSSIGQGVTRSLRELGKTEVTGCQASFSSRLTKLESGLSVLEDIFSKSTSLSVLKVMATPQPARIAGTNVTATVVHALPEGSPATLLAPPPTATVRTGGVAAAELVPSTPTAAGPVAAVGGNLPAHG